MRLLLVHFDDMERRKLAEGLRTWGHEVLSDFSSLDATRKAGVDAFVISLRRLPDHGRKTASALAASSWAQETPLFFLDGRPDHVDELMRQFDTASFVAWDELEGRLAALDSSSDDPTIRAAWS